MNRPHVFIGVAATAALLLPRLPFRGPRRARTPIVALMLATVAAAAAATACADIGIVSVAPATSRPGAIVRVRVNGYLPLRAASMPIVLVRAGLIPRPYSCQNKTAICEPIVWRGRLSELRTISSASPADGRAAEVSLITPTASCASGSPRSRPAATGSPSGAAHASAAQRAR